jgi:type IV pilus assembly protein PilV
MTFNTGQQQTRKRRQAGVGLLEVLLTVLVIAVGLLGVVSLQTQSITLTHASHMRSTAAYKALEMADRIRANQVGFAAGEYDSVDTSTILASATVPATCRDTRVGATITSATACTPQQLAQRDAYEWALSLDATQQAGLLPSGEGTVVVASDVATIRVYYDEARTGATGRGGCGANPASTDMTCVQLVVRP